jgi:hypothetical protein
VRQAVTDDRHGQTQARAVCTAGVDTSGTVAWTLVPSPGAVRTSTCPPTARMRSMIDPTPDVSLADGLL